MLRALWLEEIFPVSLYGYKSMVSSGISFIDEVVSPTYNGVFTISGGYAWRLPYKLSLDVGGAAYVVMNNRRLSVPYGSTDSILLQPVQGDISLKIGWYLNL